MTHFTTTASGTAGIGRRLGAMLYDSLLIFALIMVGTGVAIAIRTLFTDPALVAADPRGAVHGFFYQAFIALLVCGFFTWFWRLSGQTLGMQAWRVRVQNSDGSRLTIAQCLLRCVAGMVSWLCLGLGYWVAFFNADKRSWSDMLSGSVAVQLPKQKK